MKDLMSMDQVMNQSINLISDHGKALNPAYKMHIILDKHIRNFGDKHGKSKRKDGFCIKSFVRLSVGGSIDDEGIAYI